MSFHAYFPNDSLLQQFLPQATSILFFIIMIIIVKLMLSHLQSLIFTFFSLHFIYSSYLLFSYIYYNKYVFLFYFASIFLNYLKSDLVRILFFFNFKFVFRKKTMIGKGGVGGGGE